MQCFLASQQKSEHMSKQASKDPTQSKRGEPKSTWRMQAAIEARRSLEVQKLSNNLGAVQRKKLGKLDAAYEVHQVLSCCCIMTYASTPSASKPIRSCSGAAPQLMHQHVLLLHVDACINIVYHCMLMHTSTFSAAAC